MRSKNLVPFQLEILIAGSILITPSLTNTSWAVAILPKSKDISEYEKDNRFNVYKDNLYVNHVYFPMDNLSEQTLLRYNIVKPLDIWFDEIAMKLVGNVKCQLVITQISEQVFRVTDAGVGFDLFVLAESAEAIVGKLDSVNNVLSRSVNQWTQWAREAEFEKVGNNVVYRFPNGLTVCFNEADSHCTTMHREEIVVHHTPYDFFWWVKKFF